jgi:hypothetical protein
MRFKSPATNNNKNSLYPRSMRVARYRDAAEKDLRGGFGRERLGREGDWRADSFCDMTDGKLLFNSSDSNAVDGLTISEGIYLR